MKTNPHNSQGISRPCNAHDLFIVSEGLQCGNCLALIHDHRQPTGDAMKDYKNQDIAVGDAIRSIESGWHGRIESVYGEGLDMMLVCKGINFWDGSIDQDDEQHFSPYDVVKWTQKAKVGDPVNGLNLL